MQLTERNVRTLLDHTREDEPVTSVYADVDGERYPRLDDAVARLAPLFDQAERSVGEHPAPERQTVGLDRDAAMERLAAVDRSHTSGVALFLASGEVLAELHLPVRLRHQVRVADRPHVAPLQLVLDRAHHLGLALVQRDGAEIYRHQLGHTWQHEDRDGDEVPDHRTHSGSTSLREQRHNQHWVQQHYEAVGEVLRRLHEQQPLDALVVAGPHEEAVEFQRALHPDVAAVVRGEADQLPVEAGAHEVGQHLAEVDRHMRRERTEGLLARLDAAHGQAEQAATGLRDVVDALNTGRVETLLAVAHASAPGYRTTDGALALTEDEAGAYGAEGAVATDLVDELIEQAHASSSAVELVDDEAALGGEPVAALLRF